MNDDIPITDEQYADALRARALGQPWTHNPTTGEVRTTTPPVPAVRRCPCRLGSSDGPRCPLPLGHGHASITPYGAPGPDQPWIVPMPEEYGPASVAMARIRAERERVLGIPAPPWDRGVWTSPAPPRPPSNQTGWIVAAIMLALLAVLVAGALYAPGWEWAAAGIVTGGVLAAVGTAVLKRGRP